MKAVSSAQMRQLDQRTIRELGVPGEVLMERAGLGVADVVDELAQASGFGDAPVVLVAGHGNNGGDAFVAARHLKTRGYAVEVWLAAARSRVGGDALKHLELMTADGIKLHEVATPQEWEDILACHGGGDGVVVDGVLGTGISGPARGAASGAIRFINAMGVRSPVVAIDIPSGLNSDTGEAEGDTVAADVTITMGLPKQGLLEPCAIEYVGSLEVVDIGIPGKYTEDLGGDVEFISSQELQLLLPRRPRNSHKGDFGHVLVVGGARGFAGAAALAVGGALRAGAGLVSALVPEGIVAAVDALTPEAMIHAGAQTERGSLAADAVERFERPLSDFDAVLVGPGLTTHAASGSLLRDILKAARAPLVLDADALNVLAQHPEWLDDCTAHRVLTPHPGEMARLLSTTTARVQADRRHAAREAAGKFDAVAVLKGAGTLVAAPGHALCVNLTGNPGMARGGMGDVLGGILAALLAQNHSPRDAARLAVYVHGRAGDRVAWTGSQQAMLASDLIRDLPAAFAELTPR